MIWPHCSNYSRGVYFQLLTIGLHLDTFRKPSNFENFATLAMIGLSKRRLRMNVLPTLPWDHFRCWTLLSTKMNLDWHLILRYNEVLRNVYALLGRRSLRNVTATRVWIASVLFRHKSNPRYTLDFTIHMNIKFIIINDLKWI